MKKKKSQADTLLGVGLVTEFVETTIMTGMIEQAQPTSAMLIATPESGKTSIVLRAQCENIIFITDCTGKGLLHACRLNPTISHFVLTDLTTITAHRPTVVKYTIATLNAMSEEGIRSILSPAGIESYDSQHGKRGFIACLTTDLARDKRTWWHRTGFSSRVVPFAYHHSKPLQIKIKSSIIRSIIKGKKKFTAGNFIPPKKSLKVTMKDKEAKQISQISERIKEKLGEPLGYRKLEQLLILAKAHAALKKRKVVNKIDVDFLKRIEKFISFDVTQAL